MLGGSCYSELKSVSWTFWAFIPAQLLNKVQKNYECAAIFSVILMIHLIIPHTQEVVPCQATGNTDALDGSGKQILNAFAHPEKYTQMCKGQALRILDII